MAPSCRTASSSGSGVTRSVIRFRDALRPPLTRADIQGTSVLQKLDVLQFTRLIETEFTALLQLFKSLSYSLKVHTLSQAKAGSNLSCGTFRNLSFSVI